MSKELINLSPDLLKLQNEGYEIEIHGGILVINHIPYVNSSKNIVYGRLIDTLNLSGNKAAKPVNHVIYFEGDHPCNKDGSPIPSIKHQSSLRTHHENVKSQHSFSNKPRMGYSDYYEKFTRYIEIISSPAKSIDSTVTAKTFNIIETDDKSEVFNYIDTNSTRAGISLVNNKLKRYKVAIVGLGGTGSYILDLISKSEISEIHLFDGDIFLQHNAFRAPGAPTKETMQKKIKKTDYLRDLYSVMRKKIFSHPIYIQLSNINELLEFDFVFMCIDGGSIKEEIINTLLSNRRKFIDTGIGLSVEKDNQIDGIVKVVYSDEKNHEHVKKHVVCSTDEDLMYETNIQIAELNSLAATLAVIKWKQSIEFYCDSSKDNTFTYVIDSGVLINEKN